MAERPLRSWLYVPAHDARKVAHAAAVDADVVILDLEDGTPEDRKQQARATVAESLGDTDFGSSRRYVRVNPHGGIHWRADVETALAGAADGVVIAKADLAAVRETAKLVRELADGALPALAPIVTETAAGFFEAGEAIAADELVRDVFWGSEDLSADIGAWRAKDSSGAFLDVFRVVRSLTLLAAARHGRRAVDTPFLALGDTEGLAAEARAAAEMGFEGKQAIHPEQIEVINEMFVPGEAELREARELVGALDDGSEAVVKVREQMADAPHLIRARRMLARADVGRERGGGLR